MYAFVHMLTSVIRQTFLKEVGKFAGVSSSSPKGMLLTFRMATGPTEEGYREKELLLYAPGNYVGVYVRETWDVIPREHLGYDEESGDEYVKKGYAYEKGASEWVLKSYHDSGWTEAVENFLRENQKGLNGWASGPSWFSIVPISSYTLPSTV